MRKIDFEYLGDARGKPRASCVVGSRSYERSDELTIGTLIAEVLLLRKEVIQPQVPLRLPCYDFIPITTHTLGDSVLCRFGHRLRVQTAFMM